MSRRLGAVITVGWLVAGAFCSPAVGVSSPRVFTLAGNGGYTLGATGAPPEGALADRVEIQAPQDVALASDGSILYVDGSSGSLRRVGLDGRLRTVISGDFDSPPRRGPTVDATAVAALPDGTVLIAEDGIVARLGPGRSLPRVAGNAKKGDGGDGGPALGASLAGAGPLAPLPDGSLLILETTGNRIRRVRPDGIIEPAAGTGARGFSGDGGPATLATFQLTDDEDVGGDVAALADGGFLIADSGNNRVRRVWPDGRVTTVAGDGRAMSRGDGGPATAASLKFPQGVVAMPGGGFVVAGGLRLRHVRPDGTIVTLAGNGTSAPDGDGAPVGDGGPAGAAFLAPWGVGLVSAPDGSVVFTDFARIRIVGAPPIARPAVAITGVRTTRERHVVEYRTTVAGRIQVVLRSQEGHTVAARRATAPAGRGELPLTTPIPSQTYRVTITVSSTKGMAEVTAGAFLGSTLSVRVARRAIASELRTSNAAFGLSSGAQRCARITARRVDCDALVAGECDHEAAATLADGLVSVRDYRCGRRDDRRRFRSKPSWTGAATPQAIL